MSKEKIITGVAVAQQMSKADAILQNQIIPREKEFEARQKAGCLSDQLLNALKANA